MGENPRFHLRKLITRREKFTDLSLYQHRSYSKALAKVTPESSLHSLTIGRTRRGWVSPFNEKGVFVNSFVKKTPMKIALVGKSTTPTKFARVISIRKTPRPKKISVCNQNTQVSG